MNKGIFFATIWILVLSSCQLSRNVPKHHYLLKKVSIDLKQSGNGVSTSDLSNLLRQHPNQRIIGIPFRLMLFNAVDSSKVANKRALKNLKLSKANAESIAKVKRINDRRIERARSKGEEYYVQKIKPLKDTISPRRFFREWLKYKYGERPVVFDSSLCHISEGQLKIYLRKKGYYDTKISSEIVKDEDKAMVSIVYKVEAGQPYIIDSLFINGPDKLRAFLVAYVQDETKRNSEDPFIGKPLDEDELATEEAQAARFVRNYGIFGFTPENIRYDVDTNARTKRAKLTVQLLPRKTLHPSIKDSLIVVPFVEYRVNRLVFHLGDTNLLNLPYYQYQQLKGASNERDIPERGFLETYETLTFKKIKCDKKAANRFKLTRKDFNPYRIVEVDFNGKIPGIKPYLLEFQNYMEPTNIYKEKYLERSYQSLNQLDLFSAIKPVMVENFTAKTLDVHYFLTPSKKQFFSFEPRFTSSFGLLGANASLNYQNKNVFRGGERLSISLGGGFDSQPIVFTDGVKKGRTFNTFEFGPSVKLEVPGLFPAPIWVNSKRQKPSTVFNLAANFEHRDIFDRSVAQFSYTWKWAVGKTQVFTVGLPFASTIKFVQFKKSSIFESQINTMNDLFLRNSYSDQLIWEDFKFQFDWSNVNKEFRVDKGHSARKFVADLRYVTTTSLAGNTLNRFAKPQDTLVGGIKTALGNAYAQYFRTDHQFTLVRRFKSKTQLAGKLSAGFGIPYGNSKTSMPYDYSFFGGGANDNRGWKARTLGPGVYKAYRDSLSTVTQLGDIRIFGSTEYRFPLGGMISSCVFMDFGNIWTYRKDKNREGAVFTKDFYKQLAYTLGTGLRIDLSILVVRLDVGFPIFNPILPDKARWIFQSRKPYYQDGATYFGYSSSNMADPLGEAKKRLPRPFLPSLNFGIGLPF